MATVVNSDGGKWSVSGTTASYTVGDNVVAKVSGLKSGLTASSSGLITGLNVVAGDGTNAGKIILSDNALGTSKVALTNSSGGKYVLALESDEDGDGKTGFEKTDPAWVVTAVKSKNTTTSNTASYQFDTAKGYTLAANKLSITYTAPATTVQAKITGLSKEALEVSKDKQSVGVTSNVNGSDTFVPGLSFGTGDNANVITLKNTVTNGTNIALANGKGYAYTLALADEVPKVEAVSGTLTQTFGTGKSAGTMTVKSNLTAGYTLNAKATGVTYAAAKSNQVIATISGLSSTASDANVILPKTDNGEDILATGKIKLKDSALANKTVTLTSNYYTGLDTSEIKAPDTEDATWSITTKGVGALAKKIEDSDTGYMLSTNGKTLTYVGVAVDKKGNVVSQNLVTINGLNSSAATDGIKVTKATNSTDTCEITLPQSVLGTSTIKVASGTGYVLKLDSSKVNTTSTGYEGGDLPSAQDVWRVSGTTATYKRVIPAYYTIDPDTNVMTYHAEQDEKDDDGNSIVYATIKGLAKGLDFKEDINGANSKIGVYDSNGDFNEAIVKDEGDKSFTLNSNALTTTNVTIVSDEYKLALDPTVAASAIAAGSTDPTPSWTVSKGTATLKANTTNGYKLVDGTIVYTKGIKSAVLATVTGLATSVTQNNFNNSDEYVEVTNTVDTVDANGAVTRTPGVITLKTPSLDITNVKLTTNYDYKLALDNGVAQSAEPSKTWKITGDDSAVLRDGTVAYYTLGSDGAGITYNAPTYTNTLTTLTGIKSELAVKDDGSSDHITVVGSKITLDDTVLDKKDVNVTNNYSLSLVNASDFAPVSGKTGWKVYGTAAILQGYTTEGYALSGTSTIDYTKEIYGNNLAIVSGLSSGLKVENGQISSIEVAGDTITLSKGALGTGDITLHNQDKNSYKLALKEDVPKSKTTVSGIATTPSKGTAVYTVSTPEGYELAEDGSKITKNKKASAKVTISGLSKITTGSSSAYTVASDSDGNKYIGGIDVDLASNTITLTKDAPLGNSTITISGGSFKLALDGVPEPVISHDTNGTENWSGTSPKGVATLTGKVTQAGFTQTSNTTVAYTPKATDDTKATTLVTLNGLKPNLSAEEVRNGIKIGDDGVITLSKSVLTTAGVTIKNGAVSTYSLALADDVTTATDTDEWQNQTEWVTSGTTATNKTYNKGYYTVNAKGAVVYTKPTAGTTHATLTGIASTVDLNKEGYVSSDGTITLGADDLVKKNVTLTNKSGSSFKLALDDGVQQSADKVDVEWTTSGNTATAKSYNKAYYKSASDTSITYVKESNVTTLATVSGIASGVDISGCVDNNKVITLGRGQLTTEVTTDGVTIYKPVAKNVVLKDSSQTYKLVLDEGSLGLSGETEGQTNLLAKAEDPVWVTSKNSTKSFTSTVAKYNQTTPVGYAQATGNTTTITYAAKPVTKTLATINGLSTDLLEETISGTTIGNDVISVEGNVITVGATAVPTKVTLTSTDYTLALGSDAKSPEDGTPSWTFATDNKKTTGTATYSYTQSEGYTLSSDNKTITHTAETPVIIAKIAGLNPNLALEDLKNEKAIVVEKDDKTGKYIFTLNDADALKNGNVTLTGKDSSLAVAEELQPKTFEHGKWYVSKTTATLKDGKTAGYTATNATTVKYTAETASEVVATVTGLKSGLKPDGNGNIDGLTAIVGSKYGIPDLNIVTVTPTVLGKTNVKISGGGILEISGVDDPVVHSAEWNNNTLASKGTVTLTQTTDAGFTLSEDATTLTYTAGKTATLATVSGLNKSYTGDLNYGDNVISCANKVITVGKDLLTTSNATVSSGYKLALGDDAVTSPSEATGWVTSGTTAALKTYNVGYYTVNAKGQIIYTKPTAGTSHVTVAGIKSGVDISNSVNDNSKEITLTEDQLAATNVTLKNATGYSYKLALADSVPRAADTDSWQNKTEWVTSGNTATFKENYNRNSYTLNATGTGITVKKGTAGTTKATVVGVKTTLSGQTGVDTAAGKVTLTGAQINNKVTISGAYEFEFTNTYEGYITGSAAADSVTFAGDGASLNAAAGNDSISYTGSGGYVDGGAGNDTIEATGFGVTISGGAGNDSITLGEGSRSGYDKGDTIVYTLGDGVDTIKNFTADDKINITNVAISASSITSDSGGTVINVNSGKKTGSINLGSYSGDITIIDKTGTAKTYAKNTSGSYAEKSTVSSSDLLRDDNYVTMTPQLSEIVNDTGVSSSLGELDTNNATSLVQKADLVTYSSSKK